MLRINPIIRTNSVNPYQQQDAKAKEVNKRNQKDEVRISPEAKELLGASNKAERGQDVDKVQRLRNEVAAGTYHVDANKIADKLLPYLE